MELILFLKILIFLCLVVGAYQDYKTRIVKNKIILIIAILSIPILWNQTHWLIPIALCLFFLGLFYFVNSDYCKGSLFEDSFGGADAKVFIVLILGMSSNEIFIFFLFYTIANLFLIFKFRQGIPLFISILFGYFSILLLSFLPWAILWAYSN